MTLFIYNVKQTLKRIHLYICTYTCVFLCITLFCFYQHFSDSSLAFSSVPASQPASQRTSFWCHSCHCFLLLASTCFFLRLTKILMIFLMYTCLSYEYMYEIYIESHLQTYIPLPTRVCISVIIVTCFIWSLLHFHIQTKTMSLI